MLKTSLSFLDLGPKQRNNYKKSVQNTVKELKNISNLSELEEYDELGVGDPKQIVAYMWLSEIRSLDTRLLLSIFQQNYPDVDDWDVDYVIEEENLGEVELPVELVKEFNAISKGKSQSLDFKKVVSKFTNNVSNLVDTALKAWDYMDEFENYLDFGSFYTPCKCSNKYPNAYTFGTYEYYAQSKFMCAVEIMTMSLIETKFKNDKAFKSIVEDEISDDSFSYIFNLRLMELKSTEKVYDEVYKNLSKRYAHRFDENWEDRNFYRKWIDKLHKYKNGKLLKNVVLNEANKFFFGTEDSSEVKKLFESVKENKKEYYAPMLRGLQHASADYMNKKLIDTISGFYEFQDWGVTLDASPIFGISKYIQNVNSEDLYTKYMSWYLFTHVFYLAMSACDEHQTLSDIKFDFIEYWWDLCSNRSIKSGDDKKFLKLFAKVFDLYYDMTFNEGKQVPSSVKKTVYKAISENV